MAIIKYEMTVERPEKHKRTYTDNSTWRLFELAGSLLPVVGGELTITIREVRDGDKGAVPDGN